MPTEALATANLISNMDDLFDGVNASTPDLRRGKIFSTNIKHTIFFLKPWNSWDAGVIPHQKMDGFGPSMG